MPYIKTESNKVIAWVDDDYKDFDSLEEYIVDCDLCERPLEAIEKCDEFALQLPKAEDIVDDLIERLYQEDIIPEDWDEIDIKNHLTDLDWFKEEYNKLVNEFNRRQKVECWYGNSTYIYPQFFKAEIYGNDSPIAQIQDGTYYNKMEIDEVIDKINARTINDFKKELQEEIIVDNTKLTKEQRGILKESVKEYFKQHPELEVPKNEESGLPFWEDDFMETFSED